MDRRMATWDGYAILILLVSVISLSILTPYGLIFLVIAILVITHQILLRMIYSGPETRSLPFSDPNWEIIRAVNGKTDVYGFVNYQDRLTDMVVLIHGWQSSSEKFTERMYLFHNKGLHTLAVDMRGHGMAPDTPEWTAGKVIQDVKIILDKLDRSKIGKIHFYGHSLGGFICIGMHNERHQGWWKDEYGTLMLESPMAAYSPILEQMSGKISFMLPLLKNWAVKGFQKIHPEFDNLEWKDIDFPYWGYPKVPVLLLQAMNDNRLGRYHYDLLLSEDLDVQAHLIESLTHSKNRVNTERDELIEAWIDERMS
jgi:pimeloyl-ACP methyl ester carboxylesterase